MNTMYYRASSMGNLMTSGKGKDLGDTCTSELAKVFAFNQYGITEDITSKYLEKGNANEEIGITYLSTKTKRLYRKNEERIRDEKNQLTGLPDLYEGESIDNAEVIIDIKNSWNYINFLKAKKGALSKDRVWQAHTYMALTGAKRCDFAIVCTNAPINMIEDEKRRAFFKSGLESDTDEKHIAKCIEIERNMIFDMDEFLSVYPHAELWTKQLNIPFVNIPAKDRITIISVERDEEAIQAIYDRVPLWNEYIKTNFL